MTLHQLRIFLAVARLRSFTTAAYELHLSQPDVSLHIRELEEEIGLNLFERVGRKIHPTQAGELLKERADRIFAQLRETEQAMAEIKGLVRGSLLIGASTTPGMYLLPQALSNFRRRFPGINVQMKIANTEEIERSVRGMEVDIGFTGGVLTPSKELKVETYIEDELVLILPPKHPFAKKKKILVSDLNEATFILREPGSATRQVFEQALRGASNSDKDWDGAWQHRSDQAGCSRGSWNLSGLKICRSERDQIRASFYEPNPWPSLFSSSFHRVPRSAAAPTSSPGFFRLAATQQGFKPN